jgi:hypothetical protein
MRPLHVRARLCVLVLLWAGCSSAPAPQAQPAGAALRAEAWLAADTLFRGDPRWLGGDSAYSVHLGGERVLWLFGDSFVASGAEGAGAEPSRAEAVLVRNSVGVQDGLDPSQATLAFHWGTAPGGVPSSFFADEAPDRWLWPLHGIRRPEGLTLFFMREQAAPDAPMGFATVGWTVARVTHPDAAPHSWTVEPLETFDVPFPGVVGASVLAVGDHVLAYAVGEPGDHHVYLLRWGSEEFAAGALSAPEWWNGAARWIPHAALRSAPEPVFRHGATELSVHFHPRLHAYVAVHSSGYGASSVVARFSPAPEGPWSTPVELYRPPEADAPGAVVYAAKAHPDLEGADMVVTYATNTLVPTDLVEAPELYFPRFVRASMP